MVDMQHLLRHVVLLIRAQVNSNEIPLDSSVEVDRQFIPEVGFESLIEAENEELPQLILLPGDALRTLFLGVTGTRLYLNRSPEDVQMLRVQRNRVRLLRTVDVYVDAAAEVELFRIIAVDIRSQLDVVVLWMDVQRESDVLRNRLPRRGRGGRLGPRSTQTYVDRRRSVVVTLNMR